MEDEKNVVDNEVLQNEAETGEGVEEVVAVDYTGLLEQLLAEEQIQTEVLVGIRDEFADVDESIGGLEIMFGVAVVFAILEFCWACMRQWRKNILKMGE